MFLTVENFSFFAKIAKSRGASSIRVSPETKPGGKNLWEEVNSWGASSNRVGSEYGVSIFRTFPHLSAHSYL